MTPTENLCQNCFRYAMDELMLAERQAFEKHLEQCSSCQQDLAEYTLLKQSVEADLAHDRAHYSRQQPRFVQMRRFGIGLSAAALALVAFLPEQDALADKLHATAAHVHEGIVHQVSHLDSAAHRLVARVHIRK